MLDCNTFLPWVISFENSVKLLKCEPLGFYKVEVHEGGFESIPENEEDVEPITDLYPLVVNQYKDQYCRLTFDRAMGPTKVFKNPAAPFVIL